MKIIKAICTLFLILNFVTHIYADNKNHYQKAQKIKLISDNKSNKEKKLEKIWKSKYYKCNLVRLVPFKIFKMAMKGYHKINPTKKNIIVIIDYTKASTKKRFYVIDLKNNKVLFNCLVAHGRNTGFNYATKFSNKKNSKASSLGFYLTSSTYKGKHGYSLKLKGLEKNINHNAKDRAIVIHGADYVSHSFIKKYGRLGRSWGCPALPVELSKKIINKIKKGACLFIYGNDKKYFKKSKYLKK